MNVLTAIMHFCFSAMAFGTLQVNIKYLFLAS